MMNNNINANFSQINIFQTSLNEKIAYRYIKNKFSSKTIVFIHGNMSSSLSWENISKRFESKYSILCPDLRGFGNSTYNNKVNCMSDLVSDIYELLNYLKLEKIILIGLSLGGAFCMNFTGLYQNLVEKLILLGSVGISGYEFRVLDQNGSLIGNKYKNIMSIENDQMIQYYLEQIKEKNIDFLKLSTEKFAFYPNVNYVSPNIIQTLAEISMIQKNYIDSLWILNIFNISNEDNEIAKGNGLIKKIQCPVLIIHGDKDKIVKQVEAFKIHKELKNENKILKIIKNGSHVIHISDEEVVFNLIMNFINNEKSML